MILCNYCQGVVGSRSIQRNIIKEHGDIGKLMIGELDIPKIAPNEVLIETKYAALNHIDLFINILY